MRARPKTATPWSSEQRKSSTRLSSLCAFFPSAPALIWSQDTSICFLVLKFVTYLLGGPASAKMPDGLTCHLFEQWGATPSPRDFQSSTKRLSQATIKVFIISRRASDWLSLQSIKADEERLAWLQSEVDSTMAGADGPKSRGLRRRCSHPAMAWLERGRRDRNDGSRFPRRRRLSRRRRSRWAENGDSLSEALARRP